MRGEIAEQYFLQGYNCSQSVLMAFSDLINIDKKDLAKLSLPLGGGLGRLRLTCGAVTGMALAAGYIFGKDEPSDIDKSKMYEITRELIKRFEVKYQTITCKELLEKAKVVAEIGGNAEKRTTEYYKTRPCAALVHDAAEILEEYLKEQNII